MGRPERGIIADNVIIEGSLNLQRMYDVIGKIVSEREGVKVTYKLTRKSEEEIKEIRKQEEAKNGGVPLQYWI